MTDPAAARIAGEGPVAYGRRAKAEPLCQCGHKESEHDDTEYDALRPCYTLEGPCPCPGFQSRGPRKGTRRSTFKYSKAAERKAAGYLRGRRLPHTGLAPQLDVLSLGPDGHELMGAEVKNTAITKRRKDAMQQAVLAARGRGKGLIPCLVEIDKPGTGKQGVDMVSLRAEDWERLLERLSAD